jgi:hypothetical protein
MKPDAGINPPDSWFYSCRAGKYKEAFGETTEIILKNFDNSKQTQKGHIADHEVRQVTATAMAETGAATLIINYNVKCLYDF